MREYEITVIYDLGVAETGGQQAAPERLTAAVTARGGEIIKIDHWGRRRMAYPIKSAIDGDYVVSRVNLEPSAVRDLEAALRIDERVYRHLVVRADELPAPPPPREPRAPRRVAEADAGTAPAATAEATATEPDATTPDAASTSAPEAQVNEEESAPEDAEPQTE